MHDRTISAYTTQRHLESPLSRLNRLHRERESLRVRRHAAERRALAMLHGRNRAAWKVWSDTAALLCDRLSAVSVAYNATFDAVYGGVSA